MDRWGPKHVELTYVMNKTYSLKNFVLSCWTAYILQDDTRSLQYQLLNRFRKTLKYQISRKSDRWQPSCSMRMADMAKLLVASCNFAKAPKIFEWCNEELPPPLPKTSMSCSVPSPPNQCAQQHRSFRCVIEKTRSVIGKLSYTCLTEYRTCSIPRPDRPHTTRRPRNNSSV